MSIQTHSEHQACYHRDDREHIIIVNELAHDFVIEYIEDSKMFIGKYSVQGCCSASMHNTDDELILLNTHYTFDFTDVAMTNLSIGKIIDRYKLARAGFKCLVAKDKFDMLFVRCKNNFSIYIKLEKMLEESSL